LGQCYTEFDSIALYDWAINSILFGADLTDYAFFSLNNITGAKYQASGVFSNPEVQKIVILAKAGIQIYPCIQAVFAYPWIPAFARMTDFVSVHVAISIAARCFAPVTNWPMSSCTSSPKRARRHPAERLRLPEKGQGKYHEQI
jgi:hypothetical protein